MPTRLRHLLRPIERSGHEDKQVLSVYREHGVIPKHSRSDNFNKTPADLSRYQLVRRGDLVVNKMKAWSGSLGVSDHEGIVSPDYLVCELAADLHPRYLHHVLRSAPLVAEMHSRSKGIRPSQERLYWEDLADISFSLPNIEQQRRIADFLDDQVGLLDHATELRQQQTHLLGVRPRTALRDVVETLSPLRESCIPWLPLVPPDWRVTRLKYVTQCLDRMRVPLSGEQRSHRQGPYPYHGASAIVDWIDDFIYDGELVMFGEDGAALENPDFDVVQRTSGKCWVNNHAHVLEPAAGVLDPDYLAAYMRGADRWALVSGSTRPKVTQEDLMNLPVALPSLRQQSEVLTQMQVESERAKLLRQLFSEQRDLLAERKQAVITASVTGQFDVTTARSVA